jgi:hypothetical protein
VSNPEAIAACTVAFAQLVTKAWASMSHLSRPPVLVAARPRDEEDFVGGYLYLYKIAPSAVLRINDLPTRNVRGQLGTIPSVALDLYYHISFYGKDTEFDLESQRLLGASVASIHGEPTLTRESIQKALDVAIEFGGAEYLINLDLAQLPQSIQIVPVDLSLDDISKIWAMFYQQPHTVGLHYILSAIFVEPDIKGIDVLNGANEI